MSTKSVIGASRWFQFMRRAGYTSTVHALARPYELMATFEMMETYGLKSPLQVGVGSTVQVRIHDTDEHIVATLTNDLASTEMPFLSVFSPMGAALLGKREGETFRVRVFRDSIQCSVLRVVD